MLSSNSLTRAGSTAEWRRSAWTANGGEDFLSAVSPGGGGVGLGQRRSCRISIKDPVMEVHSSCGGRCLILCGDLW
ncbi:hypothetical protein GN956_G365 [Arapaima gigas]